MENRLCVALDAPDRHTVTTVARAVAPSVGMFKVGLTAFIALGGSIVDELSRSLPVFLDLKLHDIPAQVAGAAAAASELGAQLITVHAAGGSDMIAAAAEAAGETTVVAVTILTSLGASDLSRLGITGGPEDAVLRLGEIALEAGAGGLVCSPLEVASLRQRFGARGSGGPLLVVPGIRTGPSSDDQVRTMDASAAVTAGADVLVVGRPITSADDPARAAAELDREIGRSETDLLARDGER